MAKHASGIGKALLSCYPEARLDRFTSSPRTLADPEALRADLAHGRRRGTQIGAAPLEG